MHMAEWTVSAYHVECVHGRWTQDLEGWHNNVKKITRKSHLNIFEMVELFKLEQALTQVGLRQLMAGGALRSVPPKQRNKERRLKKIQEKFDNGDCTLADYLNALSFWVGQH